jgi:hypothetical protein
MRRRVVELDAGMVTRDDRFGRFGTTASEQGAFKAQGAEWGEGGLTLPGVQGPNA